MHYVLHCLFVWGILISFVGMPFAFSEGSNENIDLNLKNEVRSEDNSNIEKENLNGLLDDNANELLENTTSPKKSPPLVNKPEVTFPTNQVEEVPKIMEIPLPNEFSGVPPVPGGIRSLSEGEAPEEYVVEPGDTLFEICKQLLDEPTYWPKLWTLNPYIKNPHFIWPGMRLVFYPGDDETPPYMEIARESEVVPVDRGSLNLDDLVKVRLPDGSNFSLKSADVVGPEGVDTIEGNFLTFGDVFQEEEQYLTIPGFVFKSEKEAEATVMGGIKGELLLGEDQDFVASMSGQLKAGMLYTVLRFVDTIRDPESEEPVGYLYSFIAHVKISKILDNENFCIGKVDKTRVAILSGDILVPYISTSRHVNYIKKPDVYSLSDAHIISMEDYSKDLGGEGHMVFLDRGRDAGVKIGQYLKISRKYDNLIDHALAENITLDSIVVGYLQIIDTTEVGAVGYVLVSNQELRIGDYVGKMK